VDHFDARAPAGADRRVRDAAVAAVAHRDRSRAPGPRSR
jgi:hypothetical protein